GGASWTGLVAAALAGAALLAGGFLMGRASRPEAPRPGGDGTQPSVSTPDFAPSVSGLPAGNVVLLDELNRRVYMLQVGAPAAPPENHAADLLGFKVGSNGRLAPLGRFQLSAGGRTLTAQDGQVYPLAREPDLGVLRILRGGVIAINQPAGAQCWIDDHLAGKTPLRA